MDFDGAWPSKLGASRWRASYACNLPDRNQVTQRVFSSRFGKRACAPGIDQAVICHRPRPRLLSKVLSISPVMAAKACSRPVKVDMVLSFLGQSRPFCPCSTEAPEFFGKFPAHFFEAGGFCGHIRLHPFPAKNKGFGLIVRLGKVFHVGLDLSLIIGVRLVGIQLGKS